jgi:hypothetical protein
MIHLVCERFSTFLNFNHHTSIVDFPSLDGDHNMWDSNKKGRAEMTLPQNPIIGANRAI